MLNPRLKYENPMNLLVWMDLVHREMVCGAAVRIRKLPALLVRVLLILDAALGLLFPPWAWWLYYRHTSESISPGDFCRFYINSVRYVRAFLLFNRDSVGIHKVDFSAPPVRSTEMKGGTRLAMENACGTCSNCCVTYWLPQKKRVNCPMLGSKGCRIFSGVVWDYGNCGRYPIDWPSIETFKCPRFLSRSACRH